MDAAQHIGDEIVLHVGAAEVVRQRHDDRRNQEEHIVLVVEQRLELFLDRDIAALAHGLHVLDHALAGVEVFDQQQRDRKHRRAADQIPERVERLVRLDHIGQQHAVDHHADQGAGDQRPAQLAGVGDLLAVHDIARGQRDDVGVEKIVEAGAEQAVDHKDQVKEEPVTAFRTRHRLHEHQKAREDRHKTENQIPWSHAALAGLRVLHQPTRENAHRQTQKPRAQGDPIIYGTQMAVSLARHVAVNGDGHLLHDVDLYQRGDRVDEHDQAERADHMPEDEFFSGNGTGFNLAVHEGLLK